jgi:hypothetical protein
MPDEKFKLPQSSYEELVRVIKAYGGVSEPISLMEASSRSALNPTSISRNAGFLTATGILEAGKKKVATPYGKELSRALEHNIVDEIKRCWKMVLSGNDFFEKLLSAIRIRNGMDEDTLQAHIAYSAGQPKKEKIMTGARTVIEVLKAAGLIIESDGKITTTIETKEELPSQAKRDYKQKPPSFEQRKSRELEEQLEGVALRLIVQVNINCSPTDLEGLAGKVNSFIEELSTSQKKENESA